MNFARCDQCRYFEQVLVHVSDWAERSYYEQRCWAMAGHPSPIDGLPMPYVGAQQNRFGGPCGWRGELFAEKLPVPNCVKCGSGHVVPKFHLGAKIGDKRIGWECEACRAAWWDPE